MNLTIKLLTKITQAIVKIGELPFRALNALMMMVLFIFGYIKSLFTFVFKVLTFFVEVLVTIRNFFLKKVVVYGFLTALLISFSFNLGLRNAFNVQLPSKQVAVQKIAPVKILDRNGKLLYTAYGKDKALSPTLQYKRAPYFVDFTLQKLYEMYGNEIFENGATVITTVDLSLQNIAQQTVIEKVMNYKLSDGSVMIVSTKSGEIFALVESANYFDKVQKNQTLISKVSQGAEKININPFLSIQNNQGTYMYKNNNHSPINSSVVDISLITHAQWTPNTTLVTEIDNFTVGTWIGISSEELMTQNTNTNN